MVWDEFKKQVKEVLLEKDTREFSGRGIITCGGGKKYFTNAYVMCKILRHHGCNLPIEWYYIGAEMSEEMKDLVKEIGNITLVDGNNELDNRNDYRKSLGGWQLKSFAVFNTNFEEVMFLDADCIPLRNPEYLFESKEFREHPAIFLPDLVNFEIEHDKVLWDVFEVEPENIPRFESGMFLLNKSKCKKAIRLAWHYNKNSNLVYQVLYGDKDTFYFAFRKTNTPFYQIKKRVVCENRALVQHDIEGRRTFCHLTGGKLALHGRMMTTIHTLPLIPECKLILNELRTKWSGAI